MRGIVAAAHRRGSRARVLRIIAGSWRGRRLRFPAHAAIRPTPDRVRETLFNWIGGAVAGARCLDLFAGSGALGLEALSRGAAAVQFVEQDAAAARELARLLEEWGAPGAGGAASEAGARLQGASRVSPSSVGEAPEASARLGQAAVRRADALRFLEGIPAGTAVPFDIVFLDPPFDSDLAAAAAERLERGGWLAAHALIYVECAARTGLPPLPEGWTLKKAGRAGEVGYHLLERATT